MRKCLGFIAVILAAVMAIVPIFAESNADNPAPNRYADTLSALMEQITEGMAEGEMQAIVSDFLKNQSPLPQEGEIVSGFFVHPKGFSFPIPDGFQVLQDSVGADVQLIGPMTESGFNPTIHVLAFDEPQPDFAMLTQAKVDAFFASMLSNYQFVSLDHYEYNDVMAHEFVCLHGASDNGMIIQNALCFNKGGKAYILTMTTLAEEATLEYALLAFDFFLTGFVAPGDMEDASQENG